jgi:hypothetical protein
MDVDLIMRGLAKMQDDIINYQLDKSQEEQDRINRDFSKFLDVNCARNNRTRSYEDDKQTKET